MYPWVKLLIYHITHSPKLPISVIFIKSNDQITNKSQITPIWSDLQYFVPNLHHFIFPVEHKMRQTLTKWKRKSFEPHKKFLWLACYIPRLKTYTVIAETGSVNESFFSVSFKFTSWCSSQNGQNYPFRVIWIKVELIPDRFWVNSLLRKVKSSVCSSQKSKGKTYQNISSFVY